MLARLALLLTPLVAGALALAGGAAALVEVETRFDRRAAGAGGRRYRFETYADDEDSKAQRERLRTVRIVR